MSRENAETLQMFDSTMFKMDISLWNERFANGTWNLMGDIKLQTVNSNHSIWGGFCLGFPDPSQTSRFDCMVFKVILDLEDLEGSELIDVIVPDEDYPEILIECSKVTMYDGYQTKGPSIDSTALRIDDAVDTVDNPAINWMKVNERVTKDCTISSRDAERVDCNSLNLGFQRNFRTDNQLQDI